LRFGCGVSPNFRNIANWRFLLPSTKLPGLPIMLQIENAAAQVKLAFLII